MNSITSRNEKSLEDYRNIWYFQGKFSTYWLFYIKETDHIGFLLYDLSVNVLIVVKKTT